MTWNLKLESLSVKPVEGKIICSVLNNPGIANSAITKIIAWNEISYAILLLYRIMVKVKVWILQ